MPTIRPAHRMTTQRGRVAAGAGGATFCIVAIPRGFAEQYYRRRSPRARIFLTALMTFRHASGRLPQCPPLQLHDLAARPFPARGRSSSMRPGRPLDAVEIVAGERLGLVWARERRRRCPDNRRRRRSRAAPGQHVVVVVAVHDEFGAVPRQDPPPARRRRAGRASAWPGPAAAGDGSAPGGSGRRGPGARAPCRGGQAARRRPAPTPPAVASVPPS